MVVASLIVSEEDIYVTMFADHNFNIDDIGLMPHRRPMHVVCKYP